MSDITDIIKRTIYLTYKFGGGFENDLEARKDPVNAHLYRRWGYSIYRTYYGPGSDESWNTLLELLKQQTLLELEALEGKDQDDVQKLKELFHLEVHQDPTVFGGLNIHELREYWCNTKRVRVSMLLPGRTAA